jgi:hypothetical protein
MRQPIHSNGCALHRAPLSRGSKWNCGQGMALADRNGVSASVDPVGSNRGILSGRANPLSAWRCIAPNPPAKGHHLRCRERAAAKSALCHRAILRSCGCISPVVAEGGIHDVIPMPQQDRGVRAQVPDPGGLIARAGGQVSALAIPDWIRTTIPITTNSPTARSTKRARTRSIPIHIRQAIRPSTRHIELNFDPIGGVSLRLERVVGATVIVESSTDLENWESAPHAHQYNQDGSVEWQESEPPGIIRYFRVRFEFE